MPRIPIARRRFLQLSTAGLLLPSVASARAAGRTRERLLLDTGWRFRKGDPEGGPAGIPYDIRPEVRRSEDGKPADDTRVAEQAVASSAPVLKPWILPTANRFIADPARRHARPAGDPGGDHPFVQPGYDDSAWQSVTVPHDWAIDGPWLTTGPFGGMGRLPSWGIGWYRRRLDIRPEDKGRSIILELDGAMSYAAVWLNGRLVGGWPYGYSSWQLDLTPYVVPGGVNQLVLRLDNPPESARWYPGGGLYRNVWLTRADPVHVGQWGTRIRTSDVSAASARVAIDVTIDNDSAAPAEVEMVTEIFELDRGGRPIVRAARSAPVRATIPPGAGETLSASTIVLDPVLWGLPPTQQPNLYLAITRVSHAGRLADTYETRFGIRDIALDPDQGVVVNGERVPLKGVNNHHDLGALGAAFNRRAAERQLEILRDMGCNALRMSHNPPDPQLLDLADEMGFLVIDEVFDAWVMRKTPLDFHLVFADWHEADLRAMLRRDRNHPSIFLWSVGNEVGEQRTGEEGAKLARSLVAIVREEDERPVMSATNYAKADMPFPAEFDVVALNYQGVGVRTMPSQFPAFRARFPDKLILSSESASALSSRGDYQFPVPGGSSLAVRPGAGGDARTHQVSAYELFAADFGSSADRSFAAHDEHPYAAGEFVWTGWDYLGEPTPYYDARSSYSGIIDLAGFPKDRFYLYQARWRPDFPMAHILPHWTWPGREGEVTPVHVLTSGDEAELFVNGVSQGRQKRAPYQYRFRWDYATYAPGELKVVTWKTGKPWAEAVVRTAGPAARLEARVDRDEISADGKDLAFVSVRIADRNGTTAPRADHRIRFTVAGPGELVATDNGDPTSFEPFQSPSRKAFNGWCLAIVRAKPGRGGAIRVRAEAEGLAAGEVDIRAIARLRTAP